MTAAVAEACASGVVGTGARAVMNFTPRPEGEMNAAAHPESSRDRRSAAAAKSIPSTSTTVRPEGVYGASFCRTVSNRAPKLTAGSPSFNFRRFAFDNSPRILRDQRHDVRRRLPDLRGDVRQGNCAIRCVRVAMRKVGNDHVRKRIQCLPT